MDYTNKQEIIFTEEELSALDKVRDMMFEIGRETPYFYGTMADVFGVLWEMRRLKRDRISYHPIDTSL